MKASKKAKQELFTKRKNGERETKRVLNNLRKLKLQEIFTTVAIASCVIATRDSLFCKMFPSLFWFEQEKTLKNYSKEKSASKIKKKGEAETKSSDWDLKNALTNTNLRTVKRYEVGMCIGLFSFVNILMYRLARAKSEALDNIFSFLRQNIKSCNAKRRRQREWSKNNNRSN